MGDWRESARRKRWQEISLPHMDDSELEELFDILSASLPKKVIGHGIQQFEDFIMPLHAKSFEEWHGAHLMKSIRNQFERRRPGSNLLEEALRLATETLLNSGVELEGDLRNTYVYQHDEGELLGGGWVQIRADIGRAIVRKRHAFYESAVRNDCASIFENVKAQREWVSRYPWRSCHSISFLFLNDEFEPFTPEWHAMNILGLSESLSRHTNEGLDGFHMVDIETGIKLGMCYRDLLAKPFDVHALRGLGTLQAARSGGFQRARKTSSVTAAIVEEMERLVSEGHTVSGAAAALARQGIGGTASANRQRWYRRQRN